MWILVEVIMLAMKTCNIAIILWSAKICSKHEFLKFPTPWQTESDMGKTVQHFTFHYYFMIGKNLFLTWVPHCTPWACSCPKSQCISHWDTAGRRKSRIHIQTQNVGVQGVLAPLFHFLRIAQLKQPPTCGCTGRLCTTFQELPNSNSPGPDVLVYSACLHLGIELLIIAEVNGVRPVDVVDPEKLNGIIWKVANRSGKLRRSHPQALRLPGSSHFHLLPLGNGVDVVRAGPHVVGPVVQALIVQHCPHFRFGSPAALILRYWDKPLVVKSQYLVILYWYPLVGAFNIWNMWITVQNVRKYGQRVFRTDLCRS